MIITLKGADFSASNIGTLSSWRITRSLGAGATYEGPIFVDKGASFNATVTIADGYELAEAGVIVTMGRATLSDAYSVAENVITITIGEVTGNVVVKVSTVYTETGTTLGDITDWSYTLDGNNVVLNHYIGESTDVTVYGNYKVGSEVCNAVIPAVATETVSGILQPAADAIHPFANNTEITSVTFEDGVSIYNNNASCMFYGCTKLKTITNLPYVSGAAKGMCYGCTSLEAYPTFVNFSPTDLTSAFEGCSNMAIDYLEVPQTCSVWKNTFIDCAKLISVGDITKMSGNNTFRNCTGLVSVGDMTITGSMSYDSFNGCTALKSIGKILGTKLTKPMRMFSGCSALEGEIYFEPTAVTFSSTFNGVDLTKVTFKVPANSATYTNLIAAYPGANVATY